MKRPIFILAFVFIVLAACNDDDATTTASLNGTWKVVSFENHATGTVELQTQENSWNKDITISFDDTTSPGVLSGTNTLNAISGKFTYPERNSFKIDDFFTTYVNQPRWADEFLEAILDPVPVFNVDGNQLTIYYEGRLKSVTLIRQ